jgi:hypothetical protein
LKIPKRMSRFPRRRRYAWMPGPKKKTKKSPPAIVTKKSPPAIVRKENEDELLALWESTHKRQAEGRPPLEN